jgi:hypothetical protein
VNELKVQHASLAQRDLGCDPFISPEQEQQQHHDPGALGLTGEDVVARGMSLKLPKINA